MELDVESHLDAVERAVSFLDRDGSQASAVTLSRRFTTSVENLWDAVTNVQRIPLWFSPVEGELSLEGRYQVEGNAGGLITVCEPLSQFSVTWEFAGDVSWMDVGISVESPSNVRLTLTHTARLSEHWDQYGAGAVGVGWELAFLGLALYLEQPGWTKPNEETFALSPDGKAIITGSSKGWRQAAIAAGTDPTVADEAARRTTAFYTGEPVPSG